MFTNEQIKNIAEELDMDMKCLIHKKTKKISIIFNQDASFFDLSVLEEEDKEELEKIEAEIDHYHVINKMPSFEVFRVMENFMDSLSENTLKRDLSTALQKRRPFAQFKNIIDDSDLRETWFAFKHQAEFNWVKAQLEGIENED